MDNNDIEFKLIHQQIEELKEENKDLTKRLTAVETSKEKTEFQYEQIMQAIEKLNEKTIPDLISQIKELQEKPVKRYDAIISTIISSIVAATVGFFAAKFNN